MLKTISLHIPAYNEQFTILRCLQSVIQQNLPISAWECIVVDNNSDDDTSRMVTRFIRKYPQYNLRIVTETQQGVFYARKKGLDEGLVAGFDVLAGTDADTELPSNFLSNILKTLNRSNAQGFSGSLEIEQGIKDAYEWMELYWKTRNALKRLWHRYMGEEFSGSSFAITAEAYKEIGGMPIHDWPAGEDIALSEKLRKYGNKIAFSDQSPVTISDRRFDFNQIKAKSSHLPKNAGGAGFQPVRFNTPRGYGPVSSEEIPKIFKKLFFSFGKRLVRRCLQYHVKNDSVLSEKQYKKILRDFNNKKDFIDNYYQSEPTDFWKIADDLYRKNSKKLYRNLLSIFQKEYPEIVDLLETEGINILH